MGDEPDRLEAEEIRALARLIAEVESCRTLAGSAASAGQKRLEQIEREFADRMKEPFNAFLDVAERHGRLDLLRLLVKCFRSVLRERRAKVEVVVTTTRPMNPARQEDLRKQLAETLSLDPVLVARVDESLLGGMTVQIADRIYDASVAGDLRRLRRKLLKRIATKGTKSCHKGHKGHEG